MSSKLLLIADDQEDNRAIFSTMLTHKGYDVFLAVNGQEAIEQAKRHAPDLILMDLQMPVLDGWEATRLLKADPQTASIPVIAVSAQEHPPSRLQEGGFCAYVRKPVTPVDLAQAVETCLEKSSEETLWIELPFLESPRPAAP
jgi:two-component system cell cycle response regulator DivK